MKTERKILSDLMTGKASAFDLVEKSREVWREDVNDKPMYLNRATGQRLPYDGLQKRIKSMGKRTDFIIVSYGRKKNYQTLNEESNEN